MPILQGALRLTAALGLATLSFVPLAAGAAESAAVSVTIQADKPGAKIDRNLYGQFAEHLGHGIYEGIWVGEDSSIPNTRGYRNDVVAALKKLKVPVVRWPGGCFADEYHWREGIGPRDKRPVKVNTHWGAVEEPNTFGTHEFLDFAELIGADAYVSGNVGSGSPQEMAEWVEYITSDTKSTLAELRRRNGREKPWKLPYFGVGNETWGCGGNMRPEYFADLYKQFATFIKAPRDNTPLKIASGANVADYHWTEVMLSQAAKHMDAYSLHYYTFPGRWENKGASTGFTEDAWASTLNHAVRMEELVTKHSAIMDKYDPDKKVALYVDEWGTWYDPEPGRNPGFLYQQNTLRDALVASLTLDIFHRHADRVKMSNIAQMVNVLQAMILTDKEKMTLTPTYHVFEMYIPFQGATSLPAEVQSPTYSRGEWSLPQVSVSAARDVNGKLQIAFTNVDPNKGASVSAKINGANVKSASGRILTASALDARNTFDKPEAVKPAPFKASKKGNELRVELPPKSVVVVAVE
ncbi:alpha-N-arabinofuranosidase [Steroidobacter agaridevorans]|uniref:alpha-N-arabinofuranosidase n=1 Tax=Steroidobacter agaridevorans TaxID=2695856 RepID=UPI001324427F|nr:alpha-N-arabinofuranosidase [Steroidobacter agaridevorans]GFE88966.1 alpha-L-arabinofuranosidase [Steroidobacter agaridevorans]